MNNRTENFNKWLTDAKTKHGDKYDYSKVEYKNAKTKVCIICPTHGEFYQTPCEHLCGKGCPSCNLSHLENEIRNLLIKNKIEFISQCNKNKINWLDKQRLDFYLPKHNIAIECQGWQHFKEVEHFGGKNGYKKTLERDERKRKLCEENGVKLLYYSNLGIEYPYDVFEDKEKLLEEIKKYGNS